MVVKKISHIAYVFICVTAFFVILIPNTYTAKEKKLVEPPSDTSYKSASYISEEEMAKCVIIYNQLRNIEAKLHNTVVDQYDKKSVDSYNEIVSTHSKTTNKYNQKCAGKSSSKATKVTNELNKKPN